MPLLLAPVTSNRVTTFAGLFSPDGTGKTALVAGYGAVFDANGNLYFTDTALHAIRRVSPTGVVTTVAGGRRGWADGTGSSAQFDTPIGLAMDGNGVLYVADSGNHLIRSMTPDGVVTTYAGAIPVSGYADGTGFSVRFNYPGGLAIDASGTLYVADTGNQKVRKVTPDGVVSTVPGLTLGQSFSLQSGTLFGLAADSGGNLFVADTSKNRILKVSSAGQVSTLAGSGLSGFADGAGTGATFTQPAGIALDSAGNLFVADTIDSRIRKVTPGGVVTTVAGSSLGFADGAATSAQFYWPTGVAVDRSGNVAITESGHRTIRLLSSSGTVTTLAGGSGILDGNVTSSRFKGPAGLTFDLSGNLYVADRFNYAIRKISPAGAVTTLAGGDIGSADGTGSGAQFWGPTGLAIDQVSNLYACDSRNNSIRRITPNGTVTTLAGNSAGGYSDGVGTAARFSDPEGLTVDSAGNLYVADTGNNRIRKVTPSGVVTTLAGNSAGLADASGVAAKFSNPAGLTMDASGTLYVADEFNNAIRRVTPDGTVTTLAGGGSSGSADGTGTSAQFNLPKGLTIDRSGNLYVSEIGSHVIRKVTPSGVVTTLAGGSEGYADGLGSAARFDYPAGLALDANGYLYISDSINNVIRRMGGP